MAKQSKPSGSFFQQHKTGLIVGGVIVLILLILIGWFTGSYNGLVTGKENVNSKWGTVEAQYQRRADLIPNLVQVVGAYATQEKTVLEDVTNARAKVGQVQITENDLSDPAKLQAFQDAQTQLSGSLSRLLVVAENYPTLQSSQNFLSLQVQLEGTENRIAVARKDYNDAAQSYNVQVQSFPSNIVAGMFGFTTRAYFQADQGAQAAPVIDKNQLVPSTPSAS